MPDFQKSENLSFILSKIPMDSSSGGREKNHSEIQRILMKALIAVAEKHTGTLFSSNFNAHLLRLLMANDQNVRLLVLQVRRSPFHQVNVILLKIHSCFEIADIPNTCRPQCQYGKAAGSNPGTPGLGPLRYPWQEEPFRPRLCPKDPVQNLRRVQAGLGRTQQQQGLPGVDVHHGCYPLHRAVLY